MRGLRLGTGRVVSTAVISERKMEESHAVGAVRRGVWIMCRVWSKVHRMVLDQSEGKYDCLQHVTGVRAQG